MKINKKAIKELKQTNEEIKNMIDEIKNGKIKEGENKTRFILANIPDDDVLLREREGYYEQPE